MAGLRAPFPYFGGKASVAAQIWQTLEEGKDRFHFTGQRSRRNTIACRQFSIERRIKQMLANSLSEFLIRPTRRATRALGCAFCAPTSRPSLRNPICCSQRLVFWVMQSQMRRFIQQLKVLRHIIQRIAITVMHHHAAWDRTMDAFPDNTSQQNPGVWVGNFDPSSLFPMAAMPGAYSDRADGTTLLVVTAPGYKLPLLITVSHRFYVTDKL